MRDCYIRCLKNGNPECCPPCDLPGTVTTELPDKKDAKEPAGETTTTDPSTVGKNSIISPREIEACIYYPELKSLLSGYLVWKKFPYLFVVNA